MAEIAGLTLITPSSVAATGAGSSASVSASGKVTFTTAVTLTVNGAFTASYDNYLIVTRMVQTVSQPTFGSLYLQVTTSGTAATSGYTSQRLRATSTTVQGSRFSSAAAQIGEIYGGLQNGLHVYFYGPYLSQPTALRSISASAKDTATIADYAATHSTSTSYDGFRLTDDGVGRAFTGTLTIYGLSQ